MKRLTIVSIVLLLGLFNISLFAQTDSTVKEPVVDEAVRNTFSSSVILDNQTVMLPLKGSKELEIQHRFGEMKKINDLFGIYGSSNIRFGMNYGITDNIMIGFGTESNHKMQEFKLKLALLKQTKSNRIPVSVSYYGNTVIDGRDNSNWGANYKFTSRLSFVNSILVARKFNKRFSLQGSVAFAHFNQVDSIKTNDVVALSLNGKCKLFGALSAIFEYDHTFAPVKLLKYYQEQSKPNASLGLDINTGTHNFQVYVASYRGIIAQQNYMYNKNDFTKGNLFIGFNIIVRL